MIDRKQDAFARNERPQRARHPRRHSRATLDRLHPVHDFVVAFVSRNDRSPRDGRSLSCGLRVRQHRAPAPLGRARGCTIVRRSARGGGHCGETGAKIRQIARCSREPRQRAASASSASMLAREKVTGQVGSRTHPRFQGIENADSMHSTWEAVPSIAVAGVLSSRRDEGRWSCCFASTAGGRSV